MEKTGNIGPASAHASEYISIEADVRGCLRCGKEYMPRRIDQCFCSTACRREEHRIIREVGKAAVKAVRKEK